MPRSRTSALFQQLAPKNVNGNGANHLRTPSAIRRAGVYFDSELRELWVNRVLVKRLDARAANQIAILSAFQEENWPPRIDDPLPPRTGTDGKSRLRFAIHSLNGCQRPFRVHFFADGSGSGIRWNLARRPSRRAPANRR